MQYAVKNWNMSNKTFIGLNVQTELYKLQNINLDNTLIVVSADFSHYMPMQEAIKLENCAAKSILHEVYKK